VFFLESIAWAWPTGVAAFCCAGLCRPAPAPIRTGAPKRTAHCVLLAWLRRPGTPPLL